MFKCLIFFYDTICGVDVVYFLKKIINLCIFIHLTFHIMKSILSILFLALLFFSCTGLLAFISVSEANMQTVVNVGSDLAESASEFDAGGWFERNWSYVALIASEIAAFMPEKFTGIAKSVISFIGHLFSKK